MTVLRILQDDEPLLRQRSSEVPETEFNSEALTELVLDMFQTLKAAQPQGIGLAAPQVGRLQRVLITRLTPEDLHVLVNPVITRTRGTQWSVEGCLSVPQREWGRKIERHELINVAYREPDGTARTMRFSGRLACVVQHEIDHLDGILFTDYRDYRTVKEKS